MNYEKIKNAFFGNKERLITGIGLLIVVGIIAALNNFYVMWSVFGLISLLSISEMQKLIYKEDEDKFFMQTLVFVAVIWGLGLIIKPLFVVALIAIVFVAGVIAYKGMDIKPVFIYIYPILPITFMLDLYSFYNIISLLWLVVVVAGTDSFAYFTGKSFGKRKFSPTSPNKTLEGIAGGVLFGTIFGSLVGLAVVDFKIALVISFLVSIASVFGDLFESYLKRKAGVKDSGNILPGHGGVLDRMDGYLFAVVVMYAILEFVK
jgi:phosphatidate cytidylyltransferase